MTINEELLKCISKPQEIISEDPAELVLRAKLKSYYGLKKELEDRGLIE